MATISALGAHVPVYSCKEHDMLGHVSYKMSKISDNYKENSEVGQILCSSKLIDSLYLFYI